VDHPDKVKNTIALPSTCWDLTDAIKCGEATLASGSANNQPRLFTN